jgi:hypothetical protein
MKVVLVDCLIYQGLLYRQRRRAAGSPDRDEPITTRMKRAQWRVTPFWKRVPNASYSFAASRDPL